MNFFKKLILTVVTLSIVASLSLTLIGCPPKEVVEETTPEETTPEETPTATEEEPTEAEIAKAEELEFDKLTTQAAMETDPEKRKELYKQAEYQLNNVETAFAPIYFYTMVRVTKPWLTRTHKPGGGQEDFYLWEIDWEAKKAATQTAEEVVTLVINAGTEPPTADPSLATDTTSVQLDEMLFLGLTGLDIEANVIPELATEWTPSEDGLEYTFNMRDDITWVKYNCSTGEVEQVLDEDGNPIPVTAHDVVYGVRRTINPETASDYAYVMYAIKNGEAVNTTEEEITPELLETIGVEAVDDYTVKFTLEYPAPYFPAIANMWVCRPMPQAVIEDEPDKWTEPCYIQSNGHYVMSEWVHFDHYTLIKNPFHPDADEVQIEKIVSYCIEEMSTAFAMYENNELDTQSVPQPEIDRVKADPVLSKELIIAPDTCTYYYGFTNNKAPFDDHLVRKAFSAAIDRQTLIDTVTKGGQIPANSFACSGIFGNVAEDPDVGIMYDPEQAKAYLEEAGYPDGEGFPEVTLMHNVSEGHARIAAAIQAMWAEVLKVNVKIETQEWKVYLETLKKETPLEDMPHIWRLGWCMDYPDQNNWVHEVFNNQVGANRLRRGIPGPTGE